MAAPLFKNTINGIVGGEAGIHVTAYGENAGGKFVALDPISNPVNWSGLSDAVTMAIDDTGYIFTSTAPGFCVARATHGAATAAFVLHFLRPPLRLTSAVAPIVRSRSINFTFILANFESPISFGTAIGSFTVDPPEWFGRIILTGADADLFVVGTDDRGPGERVHFVLFAAATIDVAKTYRVTITAEP